ncbi:VOC family protein [Bacillus marinisedimentorum]|uniref:VOC family protein n=1 Tax=Bacillus marinisedimentorum TaxID=1821260 RepID=UPI0007E0223C|nr:VOC family protein [Bacillus marinisedimentorum]
MKSPIKNQAGAVFIHVSGMERAIAFYSRLLGLPIREAAHEGNIYDSPVQGGSQIILDSHHRAAPSTDNLPLLFFDTDDLQSSYAFIVEEGIEVAGEIEIHDDISFCTFRDPDGNVLMVCEDKRNAPS